MLSHSACKLLKTITNNPHPLPYNTFFSDLSFEITYIVYITAKIDHILRLRVAIVTRAGYKEVRNLTLSKNKR